MAERSVFKFSGFWFSVFLVFWFSGFLVFWFLVLRHRDQTNTPQGFFFDCRGQALGVAVWEFWPVAETQVLHQMVSDRVSRPQPASDGFRWLQTASDDFRKLRVVQMTSGGFTIRRLRGVPFEVDFTGLECMPSPRHRSEVLRSSFRRPALRGGWCLPGMQGVWLLVQWGCSRGVAAR